MSRAGAVALDERDDRAVGHRRACRTTSRIGSPAGTLALDTACASPYSSPSGGKPRSCPVRGERGQRRRPAAAVRSLPRLAVGTPYAAVPSTRRRKGRGATSKTYRAARPRFFSISWQSVVDQAFLPREEYRRECVKPSSSPSSPHHLSWPSALTDLSGKPEQAPRCPSGLRRGSRGASQVAPARPAGTSHHDRCSRRRSSRRRWPRAVGRGGLSPEGHATGMLREKRRCRPPRSACRQTHAPDIVRAFPLARPHNRKSRAAPNCAPRRRTMSKILLIEDQEGY